MYFKDLQNTVFKAEEPNVWPLNQIWHAKLFDFVHQQLP